MVSEGDIITESERSEIVGREDIKSIVTAEKDEGLIVREVERAETQEKEDKDTSNGDDGNGGDTDKEKEETRTLIEETETGPTETLVGPSDPRYEQALTERELEQFRERQQTENGGLKEDAPTDEEKIRERNVEETQKELEKQESQLEKNISQLEGLPRDQEVKIGDETFERDEALKRLETQESNVEKLQTALEDEDVKATRENGEILLGKKVTPEEPPEKLARELDNDFRPGENLSIELDERERRIIEEEGLEPPKTEQQEAIVEQLARIREFEEDRQGFQPEEARQIRLGQAEIQEAQTRENLEKIRRESEQVETTTERVKRLPRDATVRLDGEEKSREEALKQLRDERERLQEAEAQTQANISRLETLPEPETESQRLELQQLEPEELGQAFLEKEVEKAVSAGVSLQGPVQEKVTGAVVEPAVETLGDVLPTQTDIEFEREGEEAFQRNLPFTTEAQRRFEKETQEFLDTELGENLLQGTSEAAGALISGATMPLTGPVAAAGPAAATEQLVTGLGEERVGRATAQAFAEEIPEAATETTTAGLLAGEAVNRPVQTVEDLVTGGARFTEMVEERPLEIGIGETVPDVTLDVLVPDLLPGAAVIPQMQAQVQAQPQVQQQTQPQIQQQVQVEIPEPEITEENRFFEDVFEEQEEFEFAPSLVAAAGSQIGLQAPLETGEEDVLSGLFRRVTGER